METQPKLFEIEPIRIPRPTLKTIDAVKALRKVAEEINDWSEERTDVDELASELENSIGIDDFYRENGYELAKALEKKFGYSPDLELVELMDGASWHIKEALKEEVKKWVKDCWIKPKYKIGDMVEMAFINRKTTDTESRTFGVNGVSIEGEITGIHEDTAEYLIYTPSLCKDNTTAIVKNFEDIEKDFFKIKTE